MDISAAEAYYRQHRDTFAESFRLRIHRAVSWLKHAENLAADCRAPLAAKWPNPSAAPNPVQLGLNKAAADWDFAFVSLWIAFNAAYARDLAFTVEMSERHNLRQFLHTVCNLDHEQEIYRLVWEKFPDSIRCLLDNRYVFQPFWDFHNGLTNETAWLDAFAAARHKAQTALAQQATDTVLAIVFDRLYTLRNQIVHGGATFNSSANRQQIRSSCALLAECIPLILKIMMQNHQLPDWGKPFYPYLKEN